MHTFVVVLCIPALIFRVLAKTNLYNADPLLVASQLAFYVTGLIVALIMTALLKLSRKKLRSSAFLPIAVTIYACLIMPNSLVIGVPVLVSAYGIGSEFNQVFYV